MRNVYPSRVKTAKSILKNKRSLEIEKNYAIKNFRINSEQNKFCDGFISLLKN